MENIKNIGFELAYGTRKSKVDLIISLSGEEFETRGDLIELATKTDEEITLQEEDFETHLDKNMTFLFEQL